MAVVFAKTPKGLEEIETRKAGLSPRVRRALIFVDGKRSVDELRSLLLSDDLRHTLGMLEEDGYIEMVDRPQSGVTSTALLGGRVLPPGDDPLRLQKSRNFMLNTLKAFVGALGTSSLQERIEAATCQADLLAHFDEWYHAIVTSRDGRREAETLRSKLLEVI